MGNPPANLGLFYNTDNNVSLQALICLFRQKKNQKTIYLSLTFALGYFYKHVFFPQLLNLPENMRRKTIPTIPVEQHLKNRQ